MIFSKKIKQKNYNDNSFIHPHLNINGRGIHNIVCIAPSYDMLYSLLSQEDIFISVLLYLNMSDDLLQLIEKKRDKIGRLYNMYPKSYEEFFVTTSTNYELSFSDIKNYSNAQMKINRFMNRHLLDLNEIDYRYIHVLKFWLGIFNNNKIDCIISNRILHGDLNDIVVYSIAEKYNISSYIFSIEYINSKSNAFTLRKYNKEYFTSLKVSDLLTSENVININQYVHDKECGNKENVKDKESKYKLYEKKLRKRLHKEQRKNKKIKKDDIFTKKTELYNSWENRSAKQQLDEFMYMRNLLKVYKNLSITADYNKKYIFYALHFEPEATIMNRGNISNQLYVIKMLSENLPEGWMLYVKEHPMQFTMYNDEISYCFSNISYFKSELFYAQILRMKNTRLIDIETSSDDLINNAQAVATIQGTVGLEAIVSKKPLFIFSPDTTIMSSVNNVFNVESEADIKKYMKCLSSGYKPDYNNLDEVICNYIIEYKRVQNKDECLKTQQLYNDIFKAII